MNEKIFGTIDYYHSKKWGLNPTLAILFEWMYDVPSWADSELIDGEIYYFASMNKAISDLAILTEKRDTMYRYYKMLEEKGLIKLTKIDKCDYISLTEKSKNWKQMDVISYELSRKNIQASEKYPSEVGNKSETGRKNIRDRSEINPTYRELYNRELNDRKLDNSFKQKQNLEKQTSKIPNISSTLKNFTKEENKKNVAPKKSKRFGKAEFRKVLIENYKCDVQHVDDWFQVRDKHKAAYTKTSLRAIVNECVKNNYPVKKAIEACASNSWRGFKYAWIENLNNSNQSKLNKPNNDFIINR